MDEGLDEDEILQRALMMSVGDGAKPAEQATNPAEAVGIRDLL